MYPLADTALALHDLVEHWLKHRDDRATASDLISELLRRFWLGELPLRAPLRDQPWERRDLLVVLRTTLPPEEVELLFTLEDEPVDELVIELPPRVRLPADPTTWSEAALDAAYAALAEWRSGDYTSHALPALTAFLVDREDFGALCDRERWPRPLFWFRTRWPSQGVRVRAAAAQDCREWLRACAKAQVAMRPIPEWCAEALRRFPGLTKRAFHRAWAKEALPAWRRPGRRTGT